MAVPNYAILPVVEADLPFLAKFIHASKLRLSINRLLFEEWPNETIQMKMYTGAVTYGFKDPATESFKAVDTESNEIIGYFVLARKRPAQELPEYELGANPDQGTPEVLNPSLFAEIMTASAEIAKATENTDFLGRSLESFNQLRERLQHSNIQGRLGLYLCGAAVSETWNWSEVDSAWL